MKYTPYGAVGQVTGSRHLLETNTAKVLLDCGMFQGEHDRPPNLNRELPLDVKTLDAVILSHGHIDHSGCLPLLIRQGYRGKIYCSAATRDVTELMLYDTSKIQRQDYEYRLRHDPVAAAEHTPTYTDEDVAQTMERFEPVEYGECRIIKPGFEFCLYNSGHILGSSAVHINALDDNGQTTLGYTGDLGKKNMPILRGPEILPATHNLICETTYGDRVHEDLTSAETKLIEVIQEAIRRRSKVFVPSFALGRMQSIIYTLHRLIDRNAIPAIPIYVDSPLATDLTSVFARHPECFDDITQQAFLDRQDPPFRFTNLRYVSTVDESKNLNRLSGPMIILASSGMMEGGRILHHLINGLANPDNFVLIVGYMARGTLGRQILEGADEVKVFHHWVKVRATIRKINAYSAHADKDELLSYVKATPQLKNLYLVHGDSQIRSNFGDFIRAELPTLDVHLPEYGKAEVITN